MAKEVATENILVTLRSLHDEGRCKIIPREVNEETLGLLGWIDQDALDFIYKNLSVSHYISGPEPAHSRRGKVLSGSVWVFKMWIKKIDVYIKFHYCKDGINYISFHQSKIEVN